MDTRSCYSSLSSINGQTPDRTFSYRNGLRFIAPPLAIMVNQVGCHNVRPICMP